MNIFVRKNISNKLKIDTSEIGYYSYTNRWQQADYAIKMKEKGKVKYKLYF